MTAHPTPRGRPAAIVVGAGLMGRHHAAAAAAAGARIAVIVDDDRQAAEALAARWPASIAETDLSKALISSGAGVAHVCTPLPTHTALASAIAETGLHALIEKPLGRTAEEAAAIHQCFAKAGTVVCPTHQYAFQRSIADAAAWLPRAGAVRRIAFDICSAGAANGLDPDEVVADILPHPLSMVQRLLPSVDLAGLDWSCLRSAAGEWIVIAPFAGAVLVIQISMGGRPTRFLTRITAEGGSIELDNFHDFAVRWPGRVSRLSKIAQPFVRSGLAITGAGRNLAGRTLRGEAAYPGLRALVGEFYAAVRSSGSPPISAEESIAVAEARDRIVALASHG